MIRRYWFALLPIAVLVLVPLLSACGRASAIPPTSLMPTPRAVGTATAEAAEAAAAADPGAAEAVAVVDGDPAAGEVLFNQFYEEVNFACAQCHHSDSEERLIGPGLANLTQHAQQRAPDMSVVEYIHTSIVKPNEYIVDTYPENLMPQTYSDIFTEDELNDLIAYLLSL